MGATTQSRLVRALWIEIDSVSEVIGNVLSRLVRALWIEICYFCKYRLSNLVEARESLVD